MNVQSRSEFTTAFNDSIPVMMGYVPLGAAYGLLWVNAGFDWYWAPLMSLLVYTGALQFLSVNFLALGMPIWEIAMTALVVNFRHVFYGLSYPIEKMSNPLAKLYGMFALTDETYSLLAVQDREKLTQKQVVLIQLFNQSYWVIGTLLGALASVVMPDSVEGLEFALTALFIVLMQEHAYRKENHKYLGLGALAAVIAFAISQEQFLSIAMGAFVFFLSIDYRRQK
jgi:4-azaleucine resistance transporter AzlC